MTRNNTRQPAQATWAEIAAACGISIRGAQKAHARALRKIHRACKRIGIDITDARALAHLREQSPNAHQLVIASIALVAADAEVPSSQLELQDPLLDGPADELNDDLAEEDDYS